MTAMHGGGTVVFSRGGLPESEHAFAWARTGGGGTPAVFARSAVKPLQALPAVRAGVLERFGLADRHLALACASHGGSPEHVAVVAEVLAAAGLDEDALGCGPLAPLDPRAAAALAGPPRRIHHNCSGKHALALALCVAEGWPLSGYLEHDHPLQVAMGDSVTDAAGVEADDVRAGTDGCGMRTFHLPLAALGTAFGRLAGGALGAPGDRAAGAMRAHPHLVGYPGGVDTELMRAVPGLVAKIGAEGVLALGTAGGHGVAVKVLDGAGRALAPAAVAVARDVLGLSADGDAVGALARPHVLNSLGEVVGEAVAELHQEP